jgi:hypothetical protein
MDPSKHGAISIGFASTSAMMDTPTKGKIGEIFWGKGRRGKQEKPI